MTTRPTEDDQQPGRAPEAGLPDPTDAPPVSRAPSKSGIRAAREVHEASPVMEAVRVGDST